MAKPSPRERLIETAIALFNEHGYHATGIDRVLAQAGVAKKTLYRHFRSKDDLIVAALRRQDERFRHWLATEVEARAATPRERLLAVFDVAGAWFAQRRFHGCMFVSAAGEFPDQAGAIQGTCREAKRLEGRYFERLAAEAGAADPAAVGRRLALLFEGAIATALLADAPQAVRDAKAVAELVLADALPDAAGAAPPA